MRHADAALGGIGAAATSLLDSRYADLPCATIGRQCGCVCQAAPSLPALVDLRVPRLRRDDLVERGERSLHRRHDDTGAALGASAAIINSLVSS
eukprot:6187635-Pleurochrysis_carterae.AAC.3